MFDTNNMEELVDDNLGIDTATLLQPHLSHTSSYPVRNDSIAPTITRVYLDIVTLPIPLNKSRNILCRCS